MGENSDRTDFKINDRRIFTEEGDLKEVSDQDVGESAGQIQSEPPGESRPTPRVPDASDTESIDFSSFIMSLATTGMMHLGAIPDPVTGQAKENLSGARQLIQILSVLKEKTEGNLSAEEAKLLESLVYEMQMGVMSKSKSIKL